MYRINELQIKKRIESLSVEDISALDEIINGSGPMSIVCAAHILKGELELAKEQLSKMDEDEQKIFEEWPIYTLLK